MDRFSFDADIVYKDGVSIASAYNGNNAKVFAIYLNTQAAEIERLKAELAEYKQVSEMSPDTLEDFVSNMRTDFDKLRQHSTASNGENIVDNILGQLADYKEQLETALLDGSEDTTAPDGLDSGSICGVCYHERDEWCDEWCDDYPLCGGDTTAPVCSRCNGLEWIVESNHYYSDGFYEGVCPECEPLENTKQLPTETSTQSILNNEHAKALATDSERFITEFPHYTCEFCRGTGKIECSDCQNRGYTVGCSPYNYDEPIQVQCETCGGGGTTICGECGGNGDCHCVKCQDILNKAASLNATTDAGEA